MELENSEKNLFDHMPGANGCKDLDSKFIYANKEYGSIIGLENHEDVIGRTDYDMPCDTINFANMFVKQDQQVIQSLNKMKILDIHPFSGGQWKVFIFTKTPYIKNNICIGTIFQGTDITNTSSIELGALLSRYAIEGIENNLIGQNSYMLNGNYNSIKLSERQSEVLFYLLRGKTAKQIGLYLNLSVRTIHEYMDQLRYQFNAQNKLELIDVAISLGFLNTIPERILRTQLSLELKDF